MRACVVVIEASSLENPLAHAWLLALRAANITTIGVLRSENAPQLPGAYAGCWVPAGLGPKEVLQRLGGRPATIFHWWGLDEARKSITAKWFPRARRVLYVDTYPNASRPATEVREAIRCFTTARRIDTTIAYTPLMARTLRRRGLSGRHTVSMIQPYPRVMHADVEFEQPTLFDKGVIFAGRSDQLLGSRRGLEKDAVHEILAPWLDCGVPVTVQRPKDKGQAQRLIDHGYRLYDRFTGDEIFSGSFSSYVSSFAAQLPVYRVSSSTVRRRVRSGLSSRFSLGMAAAAPLLVQPDAAVLGRHVAELGIGEIVADPRESIENGLPTRLPEMRRAWQVGHEAWTAEEMADLLRQVVCGVGGGS